ncbi:hypothetical protein JTE90_018003 [Oedothorax gibbosus]|uniref:Uncharacterized protein n=1 Tax=Oedothorax gibbosus TaxID=931172 RepID=A0AAV6V716_9ARAC|nr:hypothetical protein JTE90_018003 [Oedothorax gibbosus]
MQQSKLILVFIISINHSHHQKFEMAEEWISPSKKKEAGPSQLRVGQLRQQFETPQVQSRQQRAPPTRHNVPELRKKFERGSHRQSVPGSEQAHHDETEYSMGDPSESRTYAAQPSRKGTYNVESPTKAPYSGSPTRSADNSYDLDMRIHDLDVEDFYDSIYEDPWEHMPPRRYKEELEDDVFYHGGSPRGFRQQNPHNAAQYEMLSTGRHQSEVPDMQNYPGMSHRKRTRSQPTRKPEKEHAWPMRGSQKPFVNLFLPHESVYVSEPVGQGTYNAGQSGKGTYTAEPSGKGTYTAGPSRKGTYAVGPSKKGTYTAQPARKGTYVAEPSRKGTYTAQPARKGTYNVESPRTAPYSGSPTRSADNSYDLDMRIHDLDVEDFYDSIYEDPWEHMPPRRYKEELEDDVFYHGGSPRGFRQQNPHNAAQYEMLSTGRHQSEVPDMQNYPGMSHRKRTRSQPTRKPEKEHAWPMRGSQKPFVNLFLPHESVYISEPAGKGTYNAGQSGKGTYTAGQFGKGTYTAEPSGKGTYTAGPSRKGTYAVGPSRKGNLHNCKKGTYVQSLRKEHILHNLQKGTYRRTC